MIVWTMSVGEVGVTTACGRETPVLDQRETTSLVTELGVGMTILHVAGRAEARSWSGIVWL